MFKHLLVLALCIAAMASQAVSGATAEANDLVGRWRSSGSFGKSIGCIVRAVSNLEKVSLTDVVTGDVIAANPKPVRLSAARREHEGFQLVLSPLAGCAQNVTVTARALTGDAGTISAADVTINPIGYVRIFPGKADEKLIPDPLLPGPVPDLKPGENQPVWVSIRVPDDARPGTYTGQVVLSSAKSRPLSVPIELRVRDFEIPKKISLRSSFWMFRDQINRFYHLDEVNLDDYLKWIDMALEHRLCPIDVYEGQCAQLLDTIKDGKPNPNPDFTKWDRYIDRMVAGGASTIHLGQSHHHGGWFNDEKNAISSPEQVRRVVESLKTLRQHYKERGLFDLHYMQLRDETSAPDSLNVYRDVGRELPDVKLLLTAPSGDARPLLDIPCPLTPSFDPRWRDQTKGAGGEYWWYVCCEPKDTRWANLFLHQTAVQHRVLFWQTWAHDVDGLLYWGLNFWTWYGNKWRPNESGPRWRVQPDGEPNFCPLADVPGDGFSMYPGPSPSQPLSSVRLEIMRDGEEDYEYLRLLDRLISDGEKSGKPRTLLNEARAARKATRQMVSNMTEYERSVKPYAQLRERIANAIEALQKQ